MNRFLNLPTCIAGLFAQTDSSVWREIVDNLPPPVRSKLTDSPILSIAVAILVAAAFVIFVVWIIKNSKREKPRDPYERGRFLLDFDEANEIANEIRPKDDPGLPWGGLLLPTNVRTTHFALFGRPGAGKTIDLRFLMQAALPTIGLVPDQRALIYDPKLDFVALLHGMSLRCPIKILCPFDLRSVAWDMAQDVTDPATAIEVATIIVPEEDGHNRYYPDAVRDLLQGTLTSFLTTTAEAWTLRDVILGMTQPAYLRQIITRCPSTRRLLGYFDNDRNFADVLATVNTKLGPLVPIAACWDRATERVSLEQWQRGDFILVMGNHEKLRSSLDTVNRILFKRAAELMLAADESDTRRTWLFMDEIREAKKLDGLAQVLTKGRSKGVSVCLAAQGIEGIRDAFGEHAGEELVSQAAQLGFLGLNSPASAEWASRLLGKYERREFRRGHSESGPSSSEQIVCRDAVMPSDLLNLPQANPRNGIEGYFISSEIGAWSVRISGEFVSEHLIPADPDVPNFIPRPTSHQYLRPWDDDDLARLKLKREPDDPNLPTPGPVVEGGPHDLSQLRFINSKR